MPPNSVTTTSNLNNCGPNQVESTLAHHLHHQQIHSSDSQAHYQTTIALPTAINASSSFYTPHFAMQQFSPITSTTPIAVTTASALAVNSGVISSLSANSLNQNSLYGKSYLSSNGFSCSTNGEDSSNVAAFMEPPQSLANNNEEASGNSSGSGSLGGSNSSAMNSSCSADNGGTSSNGSISSLTSASHYELYHGNSAYSKYRQPEIKPETNSSYNEKYLHAFR